MTIDSSDIKSKRIESIDVIRGLTILVMIFVNDIVGVHGTPAWMKHYPTQLDGMTFVDLVFPAFLFIIGMSMPFSIGRRLEKTGVLIDTWKHIIIRIIGLLVIGLFTVNGNCIAADGILNPHVWILLMYICVILIWNKGKGTLEFLSKKWIKNLAIILLIVLAFVYSGSGHSGIFQMRTYWWGILGLIGWAYLVASIYYILFRNRQFELLGMVFILFCFYVADEAGLLSKYGFIRDFIHPSYTLGSHAAIILLGAILGNKLKNNKNTTTHSEILKWSLGFSVSLFVAALLIHELSDIHKMFIISKNLGTIPWCLLCSAFTIWIWMISYWLIDVKGFRSWTVIVRPAGANPLFAYLLVPFVVEFFILLSYLFDGFNFYVYIGQTFYLGFLRSLFLAFSMTWLAGYLSKKGLQLKL